MFSHLGYGIPAFLSTFPGSGGTWFKVRRTSGARQERVERSFLSRAPWGREQLLKEGWGGVRQKEGDLLAREGVDGSGELGSSGSGYAVSSGTFSVSPFPWPDV